ncbi:extracellular solute-binding protein [Cohnella sp. 56]|uniref:extracellular solute-binding protein n=1 Tax=Cohnella sp. 56 TaxID=3113722 RepID=UPI0030E84A0B
MIRLKGMTWNHERGLAPLQAAAREFGRLRPDVAIEWETRSLQDFELYPLELLAQQYDLIMIDHPHVGEAVRAGALLPMDGLLPDDFMDDQRAGSVGRSYESYHWKGRQWALAVDAAAQVSASRADLLDRLDLAPPVTWEEAEALAARLPPDRFVAWPLVPVHAYSSFFTLCAQIGGGTFWSDGSALGEATGAEALGILRRMLPHLHPASLDADPIVLSERMTHTDEIVYAPLLYGYSNYARPGFAPHALRFADMPACNGRISGSMIGGVGLAISSRCTAPDAAAAFAQLTASPAFQATTFFRSGGQPGHRAAWLDADVNARCGGFFLNTLRTLDEGVVRPRFGGYIPFQEQAGTLIRDWLKHGGSSDRELVRRLNELFLRICRPDA